MRNTKFLRSIELLSLRLEAENRFATARHYRSTVRSFRNFLSDSSGNADIGIKQLNANVLCRYEAWLAMRGVRRNSSSFYMRILRASYNKIVATNTATQLFSHVYTGIGKTRKRAVNEGVVLKLNELNLEQSKRLELARDIFLFSYSTIGMAFVDIAFLRKSDISAGRINYVRRKTGQQMTVKLEAIARNIIKKYAAKTADNQRIFPIITSDDAATAYKQYRKALNQYNRNLLKLSELVDDEISISSYTARHSWATAARRHNIPLSVISAGMGHTSEKTTLIYLDSIENSEIDKANKEILAGLSGKNS